MRRIGMVVLPVALLASACQVPWLALASSDIDGDGADGDSFSPALSADGRYVAFASDASDLVPGDTNGETDVFVRDVQAGTTELVSVGIGGVPADGGSRSPSISGDGQRIAFSSKASNLAPDVPGRDDVFVRDRTAGTTVSASLQFNFPEGSGVGDPAISGDGSTVWFGAGAFIGGAIVRAMLVYDVVDGTLSSAPAPESYLVPSVAHGSVSHDGRYAAVSGESLPMPEIDAFVYRSDRVGRTLEVVTEVDGATPADGCWRGTISADGNHVGFVCANDQIVPGGPPGANVYLRDMDVGVTTRVSVDTQGGAPDSSSDFPSVGADGSVVAFASSATDLVANDTNGTSDIFVRDLDSGTTSRVSQDLGQSGGGHFAPSLDDGALVAFTTNDPDLVPGDGDGVLDVVVRAIHVPRIDSVAPADIPAGSSSTVTIVGNNFGPDTTVVVSPSDDVTIDSVSVISETEIALSLTVDPTAAVGTRTVRVGVPGPGPGVYGRLDSSYSCTCLTIS